MHAEKPLKVVKIRIIFKVISVAMVRIGVLMLPHDRVAKESHTPKAPVINPRLSAHCIVPY
jgi:hypothetical protein